MSGKIYDVDLISKKTVQIQADNAFEAVKIARVRNPGYDPDAVCCGEEQIVIYTCEGCQRDILDTEDYSISQEDGYYVCPDCVKAEQE